MSCSSPIKMMISLAMLLVGCNPIPGNAQLVQSDLPRLESPAVSAGQEAQLVDGNNSFAFGMYHVINQEKIDNLIFSPYSIWLAFSMIYAGAQGETETQMARGFHFLDQESQHLTLNAIDQRLQAIGMVEEAGEEGTPFQLGLANAVWSQQGYAFNQAYLDLLATQYGAGLHTVDFRTSAEVAREAINAWVNEATDGRIEEIATPETVSSDTLIVLTNAINFVAGWEYRFDQSKTIDGPFTLLDGGQVIVTQMHARNRLDFLEQHDFQAVQLPYVNHAMEMWIILPAQGLFELMQDQLDSELMNEIRHSSEAKQVTLTLPRFDFGSELPLGELLPQMGLVDAFCPTLDLGGIVEGGGLCIDQALHRAVITVDEEGTEAAAATIAAVPVSEVEEVEMTVNRPYIFVILARETGLILFLGQVLNPAIH